MEIKQVGLKIGQSTVLLRALPVSLAVVLASCGGGGSDIIAPANGGGVVVDPSTTPPSAKGAFSTSRLLLNGTESNSFTRQGGVFEVVLVDAAGNPLPDKIVRFSTNAAGIVFSNPGGTVLTDAGGKASLSFSSTEETQSGAFVFTASADVEGETITVNKNASITAQPSTTVSTEDPTISSARILVNNQPSTAVGAAGGTFQVTVRNGSGAALKGQKVDFSSNSADIVFGNTSGSVLTSSSGIAQLSFTPSSPTLSGAYTLTASTNVDGVALTKDVSFSLQSTDIELSNLKIGQTSLPSAGQTKVEVATLNASNKKPINGISVNFTSDCGVVSPASLASSGTGNVVVSYSSIKADGSLCAGPVNISATAVGGQNSTLTESLTVESAKPTQIDYPEGQSSIIGIKGSGSSSQATVKFVAYSDGTPLTGESITFNISKSPAGVSIGELGNVDEYKVTTNDKGEAPINIYPGETPGPVEIKATIDSNPNIFALSKGISIANARVSQKGISLSKESNIIQGWDKDGEKSVYTMRVADSQGNPVPDGTVVNFTAEGGQIQQSCETEKVDNVSLCSVNFISQNPRPKDGRITIMAVIEGEKTYVDKNKNNAFDTGEDLPNNIGNTYRDDNENGQYDDGELVYLRDGDSAGTDVCGATSVETEPNTANTCNTKINALLRAQTIMLFASDTPTVELIPSSSSGFFSFKMHTVGPKDEAGNPNNPMPRGTTISSGVKSVDGSKCKIQFQSGVKKIPDIVYTGFMATNGGKTPDLYTTHGFVMNNCVDGDAVEVIITPPGSVATPLLFVLTNNAWKKAL